jgi:hypothetical protein
MRGGLRLLAAFEPSSASSAPDSSSGLEILGLGMLMRVKRIIDKQQTLLEIDRLFKEWMYLANIYISIALFMLVNIRPGFSRSYFLNAL